MLQGSRLIRVLEEKHESSLYPHSLIGWRDQLLTKIYGDCFTHTCMTHEGINLLSNEHLYTIPTITFDFIPSSLNRRTFLQQVFANSGTGEESRHIFPYTLIVG